jgi:hypothetical protein
VFRKCVLNPSGSSKSSPHPVICCQAVYIAGEAILFQICPAHPFRYTHSKITL